MSTAPPVEWQPVGTRDVAGVPEQAHAVVFRRGRAESDDHPTPPAHAVLRRIRRLATEATVTDVSNGRQVSVDFHLADGADHARSSVLFRRASDGLAGKAFRLRLPPMAVPGGVPDREAVESMAGPLAAMRPPVAGTALFISADGVPHVAYGSTYEPHGNRGRVPAAAVTGFLADLKPAVERAVNGGGWSA